MALSANNDEVGSQPVYTTSNGVEINGHLWIRTYIREGPSGDITLIGIYCGNCNKLPIDVMQEDLTVETCRGGKK